MTSSTRFSSEWVLCVFVPVAFFAASVFIERILGYRCFSACEDGPIENLQAFVCFFAMALGLRVLQMPRNAYPSWARVFFLLGVLGALYAGLEEISYGQRIFGWATPDSWGLVNDQHETNLHNTSHWLDQKPRIILQLGVLFGGIIIPLLRQFKPALLPARWILIYPSSMLFTTALFAALVYIYQSLAFNWLGQQWFIFERGSEAQEIYLYWFILLYFWTKQRELKV